MLTELNRRQGTTIAMVLHDINLSSRYADYMVAMKDGEIHAEGTPAEVITPENIQAIYGLKSTVIEDPVSRSPLMVPIGRNHPCHG